MLGIHYSVEQFNLIKLDPTFCWPDVGFQQVRKCCLLQILGLTQKAPKKTKLLSAFLKKVCYIHLLTTLTNVSIEAKTGDQDQTAPTGAV